MELTKEQIIAQYKKLPLDVQKLVIGDGAGDEIQLIGRDTGITPEQALDVEDEVVAVLMGTSHPKDFIRNIQSKIGVDQEKARAIAEKVNEEVFQPVKESLKIVHNIKDEGALATTPVTPMPPIAPKPPVPPTSTAPSSFPQMIVPPKINLETPPKPPAPPQPAQSQNIFEQKLQGVFKMPKEETLVPPKSSPTPPTPPRPSGVDPYREQPK